MFYSFKFKTKLQIFSVLLISIFHPLFADGYVSIIGARNQGDHIFESGNKYPNLSGIKGGSRITYARNFNYGGFQLGFYHNKFLVTMKYTTTGWYINPGDSRDEDFVMGSISTEKGTKFAPERFTLYDTAHTYTGTVNFADGHTRSSMKEYGGDAFMRYYFGKATPDPFSINSGFFASLGVRYKFFKYYLYDVIQFIDSKPVYYGPIGLGLSYSHTMVEFPLGLGYLFSFKNISIEPSVHILYAYNKARDFHYQRALNFLSSNSGLGFLVNFEFFYKLPQYDSLFRIGYYAHRQFTRGGFTTKGGLTLNDMLSNYQGAFRDYIDTKEAGIEVAYIKKFYLEPKKTE
ncbi:MAG: putative porin [Leptospiraceae bacterium]|nr:putative porin [Leptospiraceae bacterium]MCP5496757.1 putative porin [Leptospiraceae bacterium]